MTKRRTTYAKGITPLTGVFNTGYTTGREVLLDVSIPCIKYTDEQLSIFAKSSVVNADVYLFSFKIGYFALISFLRRRAQEVVTNSKNNCKVNPWLLAV